MTGVGAGDAVAILSSTEDADLLEVVQAVAQLCDADAAAISVRVGDGHRLTLTHGISSVITAAAEAYCRASMTMDGVYTVNRGRQRARFGDTAAPDIRFYASAPIYDPVGELVGLLCVADSEPKVLTPLQVRALDTLAQNLTTLVELRLLQRQGRALAPAQPDLAASMNELRAELSHDLRVPLSSIVASLEMLDDELANHEDPAVGVLMSRSNRAAQRMLRMLEQHLHAGTSMYAAAALAPQVDLAEVARALGIDAATLLETEGATLRIGALPIVDGDPDEMYSVLQNLLTNAVKFARPGMPSHVSITSSAVPDGVRVSVTDNGIGIPESRRQEIFEMFNRGPTAVEGHGIGLGTVSRTVRSHGGRVGVDEVVGGGAEVWFELPAS